MSTDFKEIKEKYGSIDVLINNAGLADSTPFDKYNIKYLDKIIDLNVKAPFVCIKAVLDIMKEQKHGVILNTRSLSLASLAVLPILPVNLPSTA